MMALRFKGIPHLGVDDHVQFALAVAQIGILQAVEFLGSGREIGKQGDSVTSTEISPVGLNTVPAAP